MNGQKVAVLGNQNGNGFSIMRYLRDLGVDAYLIQFSNDGDGGSDHFFPEEDTCSWPKWEPFVLRARIPDYVTAGASGLSAWVLWLLLWFAYKFRLSSQPYFPISVSKIRRELDQYDVIIGSGISAAISKRIKRPLDLFFPYSNGVEYIKGVPFRGPTTLFGKVFFFLARPVRQKQMAGLRDARMLAVGPDELTESTLKSLGVSYPKSFVPQVYPYEGATPASTCLPIIDEIEHLKYGGSFIIFSAVRQFWEHKRNDWVITAFSQLINSESGRDSKLLLMEYGPDVCKTKALISNLGIDGSVLWLPKISRLEVRAISRKCDVAVGQFSEIPQMWGSVSWEALADGLPLVQGFLWGVEDFESRTGADVPPILIANSADQIANQLARLKANPGERKKLSDEGRTWFSEWSGHGLARKWIKALGLESENTTLKRVTLARFDFRRQT